MLNQRKYIYDILHDVGLMNTSPVKVPFSSRVKMVADSGVILDNRHCLLCTTIKSICAEFKINSFTSCSTCFELHQRHNYFEFIYPHQTTLSLTGFSDVDWASCITSRKSLTGSPSSDCSPCTMFCDNKVAQQIVANPCFHEWTKHLEINCHFTRTIFKIASFRQLMSLPNYNLLIFSPRGFPLCNIPF